MNLILLTESDFTAATQCVLRDARAQHIVSILNSKLGDTLKVGLFNGNMGSASIQNIVHQGKVAEVTLHNVELNQEAPAPLPITLFLALPRPRMLGRLLRDITSLGVKNIHLFHSKKVENSFWQTPALNADSIHERVLDGLMQARDTALPTVHLHRKFRDAMDAHLQPMLTTHCGVLADPFSSHATPSLPVKKPVVLLIGPEGGFTDEEREHILHAGCQPLWLGSRILRVETAAHNAIGRLSHCMELP